MMKVFAIIGTRPEAIKMAPVIKELYRREREVDVRVVSTGQHRQMLDQALLPFGIQPDLELSTMRPSQTLAGLTAAVLTELDREVLKEKPDWVLAQGDTTSVMAASLVAFYRGVRFGHVEAGLRTGNMAQPFPEELNRRIADLVASLYFAPTLRSKQNLLREGVAEEKILVTGNTVVDALMSVAEMPFDRRTSVLGKVPEGVNIVLVTAHRRESFGEPFREICEAIKELAHRFPEVVFFYPVHLNPEVRRPVQEILAKTANIILSEPLEYLEMVHVMKSSSLILTDSGGVQEEAPTFGVPVLVMRSTTERPEGVEAGFVELVGSARSEIVRKASDIIASGCARRIGVNPYGDGFAAKRIVDAILGTSGSTEGG
jgi:UDP-N-acetylglucosamine 2-epimerase (non-hydrolysing)